MRKVAIVGKADRTRPEAPFTDPEWELWAHGRDFIPGQTRCFEIHAPDLWVNAFGDIPYVQWLNYIGVPVYVDGPPHPDIKKSVTYPLKEVTDLCQLKRLKEGEDDYYESTCAYMLGLAILEHHQGNKIDRLGIWGIDMAVETEYGYQRPNVEYMIGFARGIGINVYVPRKAGILSSYQTKRYGLWRNVKVEGELKKVPKMSEVA